MSTDEPLPRLSRRSFGILFAVSIVVAVGNTGLLSVLPAIGREIGIPDPMVAAIFSWNVLISYCISSRRFLSRAPSGSSMSRIGGS